MSVEEGRGGEELPALPISMEDCGIYQDDRYDCEGYGRGAMCTDDCRYLEASWERWEQQARERHAWIHGMPEEPYSG